MYVRIAETFTHQVANGALPADRVRSLRKLSEAQGVNLSDDAQVSLSYECAPGAPAPAARDPERVGRL